mmetsp:Transcript_21144/g.54602  ORF Transcript_21144/g.54602 Transcript_21144/m.54602 type:complete len:104 (+) Transcript_21144:51-362(+)
MFGNAINNRGLKEKSEYDVSAGMAPQPLHFKNWAEKVKNKLTEVKHLRQQPVLAGRDSGTRVGMAVGGVGMMLSNIMAKAKAEVEVESAVVVEVGDAEYTYKY